ncbi:MAG: type II secretion system minor pseudopilin GspK [Nitrospiraceae bacterium]|nr:MAG: type II secretion system minor pseudopilin GspK [Nitrospiraceae bacterium]
MTARTAGAGCEGSALIVTLLLIAILTGLVVDFVYEVYVDTSSLSNWGNAQRASLVARSGQALSSEFIARIRDEKYTDRREVVLPVPLDFGSGVSLMVKLEDESARFNVNSIILPNGRTDEKGLSSLKKLFEYLTINPSIAESIADWIDPDSEPRLIDSENGAKNAPLWSMEELKQVQGMDSESFGRITPFVTVYRTGNMININTAELPVLLCLDHEMTETLARNIIDHREITPFENSGEVQNISGMGAIGQRLLGRISVKATSFRVTSHAAVHDITRVTESVMDSSMKISFWREG